MHPESGTRQSYLQSCLADHKGPAVAATDYTKAFADQVRPFMGRRYAVLGTDGYGRSDTREKLREFFEVDRRFVVVAALKALSEEGEISPDKVSLAIKKYGLDPDKPNPLTV